MIQWGSGAYSYSHESLTMWTLWRISKVGGLRAAADLNRFLDAEKVQSIHATWLLGIEVDQIISLPNGFEVRPLESMPESRERNRWHPRSMSLDFPTMPAYPKCALVKIVDIPRDRAMGEQFSLSEYASAAAYGNNIAYVINALDGVAALPYYSTSYHPEDKPLGPFGGSGGGSPVYDVQGRNTTKLDVTHIETLAGLVAGYERASSKEQIRFQTILKRLSQAKQRLDWADKLLDLSICLEMLLLDGTDGRDQLALSFRLRGAWLLGSNHQERHSIYNDLKTLYGYRCQVAHGGRLSLKSAEHSSVETAWPRYVHIAERVMQKMLLGPEPNWDALTLGTS